MLHYKLSARFVLVYEENAYQNCMMHCTVRCTIKVRKLKIVARASYFYIERAIASSVKLCRYRTQKKNAIKT